MKTVFVKVDDDGNVIIDFYGFVGKTCETETLKLIKKLEELGITVNITDEQKKPEYYVEHKEEIYEGY